MEFRIYEQDGKIKYGVDMTPKELSDLKDEICEAIDEVKAPIFGDRGERLTDAIFGTLANWNIVIE